MKAALARAARRQEMSVAPAKAGAQSVAPETWVPAYAGTTSMLLATDGAELTQPAVGSNSLPNLRYVRASGCQRSRGEGPARCASASRDHGGQFPPR